MRLKSNHQYFRLLGAGVKYGCLGQGGSCYGGRETESRWATEGSWLDSHQADSCMTIRDRPSFQNSIRPGAALLVGTVDPLTSSSPSSFPVTTAEMVPESSEFWWLQGTQSVG